MICQPPTKRELMRGHVSSIMEHHLRIGKAASGARQVTISVDKIAAALEEAYKRGALEGGSR